jgi:hypothetical protein
VPWAVRLVLVNVDRQARLTIGHFIDAMTNPRADCDGGEKQFRSYVHSRSNAVATGPVHQLLLGTSLPACSICICRHAGMELFPLPHEAQAESLTRTFGISRGQRVNQ